MEAKNHWTGFNTDRKKQNPARTYKNIVQFIIIWEVYAQKQSPNPGHVCQKMKLLKSSCFYRNSLESWTGPDPLGPNPAQALEDPIHIDQWHGAAALHAPRCCSALLFPWREAYQSPAHLLVSWRWKITIFKPEGGIDIIPESCNN